MTTRRRGRSLVPVLALAVMGAACSDSASDSSRSNDSLIPTAAVAEGDDVPSSTVADDRGDVSTVGSTAVDDPGATVVDPPKEMVTRSVDATGDGVVPVGFGTATLRVTAADGSVCDVCMWLADEAAKRNVGLMGVTDLGAPVGMAFAYESPSAGNFFMFGTPTPLSIAWFAPDGLYLTETDMEPCLDETADDCERYGPGAAYTLAVEMFRDASGAGQLSEIGIGPGSTAQVIEVHPSSSSCDQAL